jgi:hypothetical protein
VPEGRSAEYLAVFQLSTGVKSVAGPVLVTGLVLPAATVGWGLLAGLVATGSVGTIAAARGLLPTDGTADAVETG